MNLPLKLLTLHSENVRLYFVVAQQIHEKHAYNDTNNCIQGTGLKTYNYIKEVIMIIQIKLIYWKFM